jgi:hypothetical protein
MQEVTAAEIRAGVQRALQERQQERPDVVAEAMDGAKKGLLKWIGGGMLAVLAVAGLGLVQINRSVRDGSTDLINSRIAAQFSEPHIQQTLREVATTRANDIIQEQLRPAIDRAQADIAQSLRPLQESMAAAKEQLASITDEVQRERYRIRGLEIHVSLLLTVENRLFGTNELGLIMPPDYLTEMSRKTAGFALRIFEQEGASQGGQSKSNIYLTAQEGLFGPYFVHQDAGKKSIGWSASISCVMLVMNLCSESRLISLVISTA